VRRFDNLVIDGLFQPLSNLCARWWSPYDAASFLATGYPIMFLVNLAFHFSLIGASVTVFTFVGAACVAGSVVIRANRLRKLSERGRNTMNPERIDFGSCLCRNLFLGNAVFFTCVDAIVHTTNEWITLGLWVLACAGYFLACEHHPPLKHQSHHSTTSIQAT
jgi:hypothetical protein